MTFKYPAHSYALQIESILRKTFELSDRGGFGGIADADTCESFPFIAIVSALATKYKFSNQKEIDDFISEYYYDLRKSINELGEVKIKEIIEEFKELMKN